MEDFIKGLQGEIKRLQVSFDKLHQLFSIDSFFQFNIGSNERFVNVTYFGWRQPPIA